MNVFKNGNNSLLPTFMKLNTGAISTTCLEKHSPNNYLNTSYIPESATIMDS